MDILLDFDGRLLTGDARQVGADLEQEDGLKTAVILSLFTDRRAEAADGLPTGEEDRRGWWGDLVAAADNDRLGSRLWLLLREKQTPEVLMRAEEYAREALNWLLEDGVAKGIEISAEWVSRGLLGLRVVISRPAGDAVEYRFNYLWEAL